MKAVIELMRARPQGEHGIDPRAELTPERKRKVDLWMRLASGVTGAAQRAYVTEALAYGNGHPLVTPV